MVKKFTLLAMAIGILTALTAPASAPASELTMPVPTKTLITGTSTDAVTTNLPEGVGGGKLECETMVITDELTQNDGTTVKGVGTEGVNEATGCETSKGINVAIETLSMVEIESTETGTGQVHLTFIANFESVVWCHYNGTGTFHFTTGSDEIEITPTALSSTAEVCVVTENEEPVEFHGHFTLETPASPVTLQ